MKSNTVQAADQPIYYVYALLDTRVPGPFKYGRHVFKFKPFYIGKGSGTRHQKHITMARGNGPKSESQKSIKIRNIVKQTGEAPDFRIIKKEMSEQDAYDFERKLVQTIGRIQLKTGPLTNKSDGGEGQKNVVRTAEYRAKLSEINVTRWAGRSDDEILSIFAKVRKTRSEWTPEQRAAVKRNKSKAASKHNAGLTPEQVQARSAAYIASCLSRTEEERQALGKKMASARQAFFDSLTEDEYAKFHKRAARKNRQQWLALTDEQRADIIDNRARGMTSHWSSMSASDRQAFGAKVSAALQSMPEDAKSRRRKNISKGLKATYAADPEIKLRTARANSLTRQNYTEAQHQHMSQAVSSGHASRDADEKRKTSKRMSRAGKARVANMTAAERKHQSNALSAAQTEYWSGIDGDERAARSEALKTAHAGRDSKTRTKIAEKISATVSAVHARRTAAESTAIADRISETLRNKSPADRQRLSAGNVMRGLLKRHGIAVHHPVLRPQLDRLISNTRWDGRTLTMDHFSRKCERLAAKTKL